MLTDLFVYKNGAIRTNLWNSAH